MRPSFSPCRPIPKAFIPMDALFVVRGSPQSPFPSEAEIQSWVGGVPGRQAWPLPGQPAGLVLATGLKNLSGRAQWEALRQSLGWDVEVIPAQENWFPTGELTARREAGWTPPLLRTLAGRHGLELVRRAAFTSREALFKPIQPPSTYLPEALEKLKRDPLVDEAWMDAQVAFKRGR